MIVLNLSCGNGHRFEGWFASLEVFQAQAEDGQVTCPQCNDTIVTKLPAGPHVRRVVPEKVTGAELTEDSEETGLVASIEKLLRESEDVGTRFPEEARKIHYSESPARNIHGTASVAEVSSLLEEDIRVIPLPVLLRKDIH